MSKTLTSLFVFILWLSSAHAAGDIAATQEFIKTMTIDHGVGVLSYDYDDCLSLVEENDLLHERHAIDFADTVSQNYGFVTILEGSVSDLRIQTNELRRPGSLSLYFDQYGSEVGEAMSHLAELCRENVRP